MLEVSGPAEKSACTICSSGDDCGQLLQVEVSSAEVKCMLNDCA